MDPRWLADYALSNEEMSAIVECHTSIVVDHLELLGEGWDFRNYLVNREWVFRHPKRYSDSDTLVREKTILDSLQIPLAHPQFEFWIPQPRPLKVPLAGYQYIPGVPLANVPRNDVDLAAMGETLGPTLAAVHRHPITGKSLRRDPLDTWIGARGTLKSSELPVARRHLSTTCYEACTRALGQYETRDYVTDMVTSHNDLGVEHVLMNDAMTVCAIIDWADARVANRYVDFAGLWGWGGDAAVEHVLKHYPVKPDIESTGQIRTHGLCYALGQLLDGVRLENEPLKLNALRWIRERHSDGSLNDIYAPFII